LNPQKACDNTSGNRFRVFIGGFFHETHTFLDGSTPWNAFRTVEGKALTDLKGDASPLGGVLDFAEKYAWNVAPSIFASALPSAILSDDAVEKFWNHFEYHWKTNTSEPVDAIYLVLHGAGVSVSFPDVEGELLRRIRNLKGASNLPIFGVYDLHANFSQAMACCTDALVGYRENPHFDAKESGVRAASLLNRSLNSGIRPRQYLIQPPIIWPPTGTASASNPMKRLLQTARQLEAKHPEFWAVNINGGFAFADSADTGVSFSLVTDGQESIAREALEELSHIAMEYCEEGNVLEVPFEKVLFDLAHSDKSNVKRGPVILAEPSDNVGGGAPGDGTGLLRLFLQHRIDNSAVCLWDPDSVARLFQHTPGSIVALELGGRGSNFDKGPVKIDCELIRLSNGDFELEDKQSHLASVCGNRFDMGQCALIRHAGVTILLTSNRTPPMDLGQWRHLGVNPEELFFIGVKAAVAHRRAYDPIASANYLIETPGPCQSKISEFPYRHIRRPIYPLDPLEAIKLGSLSYNHTTNSNP